MAAPSSTTLLFVYGTLMRGEVAHDRLEGAMFVGHHVTEARFTLYAVDWYPGAALDGGTAVEGELYRVDAEVLDDLAAYEGDEYRAIDIPTAHGRALMYVYGGATGEVIPSGSWRAHPLSRAAPRLP